MIKTNNKFKLKSLAIAILATTALISCNDKPAEKAEVKTTHEQTTAVTKPVKATPVETAYTKVTEENYPRAETQLLTEGYIKKIGTSPKVFYSLASQKNKISKINVSDTATLIINNNK